MTCVSERSGIASSGTLRTHQTPSTTITPDSTSTMNLFRALKSMMRSIMRSPASGGRVEWSSASSVSRVRGALLLLLLLLLLGARDQRRLDAALRVDEE